MRLLALLLGALLLPALVWRLSPVLSLALGGILVLLVISTCFAAKDKT